MLNYPVDIKQISSDLYRALWVDFPDFGRGESSSPQAAFEALVQNSYGMIADLIATGRHVPPSPADGRPVVSFTPPAELKAPHIGRLLSVTRSGSAMATYSWTNDVTYVE